MALLQRALEAATKNAGKEHSTPSDDVDPLVVALEDFVNAQSPKAKAEALRNALELAKD